MRKLKHRLRGIPAIGHVLASVYAWVAKRKFSGSADYWENRYRRGGNSGDGSYGELALFKAEILNGLVAAHKADSVIEFGCGDGNQLALASYPKYLGLDVSSRAIAICEEAFRADSTKSFAMADTFSGEMADAALSLDVLFHLVEDGVFDEYMKNLFSAAKKLVVIYSSNTDVQEVPQVPHVRHRRFSSWVEQQEPGWYLKDEIENRIPYDPKSGEGSPAKFYVYLPRKQSFDEQR